MQNRQIIPCDQRSGLQMVSHSPNLNRRSLRGDQLVEQMADDMRVLAANAGSVDRDLLETIGYSAAQIDGSGGKARAMAYDLAEQQREHSAANHRRAVAGHHELLEKHKQEIAARFSAAQQRTIDALKQYGSLQLVRAGWAMPGSLDAICTTQTGNALVAGGFCKIVGFTSLRLVKPPRARRKKAKVRKC